MRDERGILWAARAGGAGLASRGVASSRVTLLVGLGLSAPFLAPPLSAQSAEVREGNRLYAEGRFEEAHERYLEALAADPESALILFNDGSALYQGADYERALEAYRRAIESGDRELAASAWYNLGNTLYRQQQLQQSLEAYKEALRLDPFDSDAKHNLERVLEQLQQQEQQQGGDDEQDEQEQQQDPQSDQEQQQREQDPRGDPEQQQPPEGDQNQQQPPQTDPRSQDQPPPEGEGQAEGEPRPEEMTPEEAERLLDAIEEDPSEVDRRRAAPLGRQPRKPW